MKMCKQIFKNIARRIPETTQLEQVLWTLNLHKRHKKFKEE